MVGAKISRRDALLASSAAVLTQLASEPTSAQETKQVAGHATFGPFNVEGEWAKQRDSMVDDTDFQWLSFLRDENGKPITVDGVVFSAVSKLQNQIPEFDPYQIESLATSASVLLERCVAYRKEMFDLEELAVRHALEYKLFSDQFDALREIEMSQAVEGQRASERDGQIAGTKAFASAGSQDVLALGFGKIAEASAISSDRAVQAEKERKIAVEKKWAAARDYQRALRDRHSTKGHALNFGERHQRAKQFLIEDVSVAFQKLRCLDVGVQRVFGISDLLFPKPTAEKYLDEMIAFIRRASKRVEVATIKETVFEVVVPLKQGRVVELNPKKVVGPYLDKKADPSWKEIFSNTGDGTIEIDLKDYFGEAVKRPRLTQVGVSIDTKATKIGDDRLRSVAIAIFPPEVLPFWGGNLGLRRQPIVIGKANVYDPNQPRAFSATAINNVDPRGKWIIQVSTNMIFPDATDRSRSPTNIEDVKLHLTIAAVLTADPSAWKALNW